ncbi:MAG: PLP-dependent aspartate aminotransferase family protein [Candidatus Obscuribacterales bacterium]|nr:PLP-dependent aspartate aminotransferase family protein [Candidatus Obscuribacterales bacterium]
MEEKDHQNASKYNMRTRMIEGNYGSKHWDYNHHIVPPMSASCAYRLENVHRGAEGFAHFADTEDTQSEPILIYDRLDEPARGMLEEKLACAEGGDFAICFATGMAAISAALGVTTKQGDEIVAHHTLYGCTYSLLANWLPRQGITTTFVDLKDQGALWTSLTGKTRVVYLETPVNPTLDLLDIAAIKQSIVEVNATRPSGHEILLIVDNTFATPFCQRPLALGADLVVHSLTKNIGGFGTDMGGAVVAAAKYQRDLLMYRKDFGGVLSPKSAWPILVYGLPTLATRMVNQQKSAMEVASFLESHPMIEKVIYPGLKSFPQRDLAKRQMFSYDNKFAPGSVVYFVLKGNNEEAQIAAEMLIDDVAKHSRCLTLAVSLGQIRTLIEAPYSMTHASLPDELKSSIGISPGGIRLSLGLEDWRDIIADLSRALSNVDADKHQVQQNFSSEPA